MWLRYLILGQKSHLPEQVSPSAPTYGTYSCPQHEHSSPSTTETEARMGNLLIEQGNQVTVLHFLRGTTVPHSNDFVLNILAEILHSLIFSGIFPYFSRHSLQSTFSMVINRYSSQVYTAHAQNKKTQSSTANRFEKKPSNNQILKLYSRVNNQALQFLK